ncbi:unnamed protein product [Closterium sp. Yama58-4]|nr:unnamed protein product [Closterium sp. Yama58-4]
MGQEGSRRVTPKLGPVGTEVLVSRSPTLLRFTIPPQRFSLATLFGIIVVLFLMAGLAYISAKVVSYRVPPSALYYFIPIWVPLIWLLVALLLPHIMVETVTVDSATCQLTIRRTVNGMTLPCCGLYTATTDRIQGAGVNFTVDQYSYDYEGEGQYYWYRSRPTTFCQLTMAGGRTLSFGYHLSLPEQRWLSLHIASFLHVPWY